MAILKKALTEEEVKKLREENKLSADELDEVNGGYIYLNDKFNYEVIDDKTGDILAEHYYWGDAVRDCKKRGLSDIQIDDNFLNNLRGIDNRGPIYFSGT